MSADWPALAPYRYERPPFGEFGAFLTVGARLVCHVCGRDYLNLQTHAWAMHGLRADEYREVFRIPSSVPLWAAPVSKKITESNERRLVNEPDLMVRYSALALENDAPRLSRVPGVRKSQPPVRDVTRALIAQRSREQWERVDPQRRRELMLEKNRAGWAKMRADPVANQHRIDRIKAAIKVRTYQPVGKSGEDNPQAKLTAENVRAIRGASLSGDRYPEIAKRYGVSKGLVHLIVRRKIWTHVE